MSTERTPETHGQLAPPIRRPPTAVGTMTLPPPHGGRFEHSELHVSVNQVAVPLIGIAGFGGTLLYNTASLFLLRFAGLALALTAVALLSVPIIAGPVHRVVQRRREARWLLKQRSNG